MGTAITQSATLARDNPVYHVLRLCYDFDMTDLLPHVPNARPGQVASLTALAAIPEEEIWLASQKSARTRRAYEQDVAHFMRTIGTTTPEQLRQVDHRPVIAWERIMREQENAAASTIRRRLAALSSLFKHLVRHGSASRNPVADVQRPPSTARKAARRRSARRRRGGCSTRRRPTQWRACATGRYCLWGCRWGYVGPRSPRSPWATCTRTGASMRFA
jgi:hypothetical protein